MTVEEEESIFSKDAQASFLREFGMDLARGSKKFGMDSDKSALNPIDSADSIHAALQNAKVDKEYRDAVVELKNDPDIQRAVSIFSASLEGKEDILKLNDMVPRAENTQSRGFIAFVDDPGMNGAVLKGTISETGESDLVRYSNYISGAGTSVGGFLSDLPQTVSDLQESIAGTALFRYNKLEGQLKKHSRDLKKVIEENDAFAKRFLVDPEEAYRKRKPYYVNLNEGRGDVSAGLIKVEKESTKTKLLRETFKANVAVEQAKIKNRGKLKAQKILGHVGTGIGAATTGFSFAQGGIDIAAGDQMIENAQGRLERNEITQDEYDKLMRDARLRIAQGSFGIGDGLNNVRALVVDKLGDKVKTFSKGAKMGLRFASAVGGAFAIGMGITSITKNAIAAHDASESGNVGKAAMYGIMAALDCVSVVLDGASMVCDFVPVIGQAISFVLDVVNTIVNIVNMIIGFFADMVDTRTPEEKLREAFQEHIDSEQFQEFLRNQEKIYRDMGYDVLQYVFDAKAFGFEQDDYGVDPTTVYESVMSGLTTQAKKDLTRDDLRIAIIDRTDSAFTWEGRSKDDLIRAGKGDDTLYGHAGDDLLFGETGNDTIYGGPGNDFLSGGVGKNFLYGEEGDDFLEFRPGIDAVASGGAGVDTLKLLADYFKDDSVTSAPVQNALILPEFCQNRVYTDFLHEGGGHAGISLGALIHGLDMLKNKMHKSAFSYWSPFRKELLDLFTSGGTSESVQKSSLDDKYLWLLAYQNQFHYLTDGKYIYRLAEGDNGESSRLTLRIDTSDAVYDEGKNCMKYTNSPLRAALGFAFWTRSEVSGIENIILDDDPAESSMYANIVGDESVRMIDLKGGNNEYVYTGEGNTVVMFTISYSNPGHIMKYIVGGSGANVLIINGKDIGINRGQSRSYQMNQVVLLDHNVDVTKAIKAKSTRMQSVWDSVWEDRQFGKVDRAVFIKNMGTIQLSSTTEVTYPFYVDAVNLADGHRFIVDSFAPCHLMGTQADDFVFLRQATTGTLHGQMGRNVLSLEESNITTSLTIDLGSETSTPTREGSVSGDSIYIRLNRFTSVQGYSCVSNIIGHDVEDNVLVANGRECTIKACGGKNTLVAKRGRHTLVGGSGQDGYELHAPSPLDFVVVSISKKKEEGIHADARNGDWSNGVLLIDALKEEMDYISIISDSITILDSSGEELSKTMVSYEGRKLKFTPGNNFNDLETGRSTSVRIQYRTEGSFASISEQNPGNRLKLFSVMDKSELKVAIDDEKNLEFRTSAAKPIFKDLVWGEMYRSRITNLETLASSFSERFPLIQMGGTDDSKTIIKEDVYNLIVNGLSHMKQASVETVKGKVRQNPTFFDSILDTKDTNAVEIVLGPGKNFLLGRRRKVTYIIKNGENILDLSNLGSASDGSLNRTFVDAAEGTVVIALSVDSIDSNPVAIRFSAKPDELEGPVGQKNLVIKGTLPSTVRAVQWTQQPDMKWGLVDTSVPNREKTFVVMDKYPDVMLFSGTVESEEVNILVDDVSQFWSKKLQGDVYHARRVYDSKYAQQLDLSFLPTPYDFSLRLTPGKNGMEIELFEKEAELYTISCALPPDATQLDAVKIAQLIRGQFPRGIKLKDETYMAPKIRRLVMDCFLNQKYSILAGDKFDEVVHSSAFAAGYHAPDGNILIYANDEGGRVHGGHGNNYVKISESNMTVSVGECLDNGRSVVELGDGVTDTLLTLSANTYLILNGWNSDTYVLGRKFRATSPNGEDLDSDSFTETDPLIISKEGTMVARLNRAPSYMIFRDANMVGVVENVLRFCCASKPVAQLRMYGDRRNMRLCLPDCSERQFYVGAKDSDVWLYRYDANLDTPLRTIATFSIGTALATNSVSGFTARHAATCVATYTPEGIQFKDTYVPHWRVEWRLQQAMSQRTPYSAITFEPADTEEGFTVGYARRNYDPHKHLFDVLDATRSALTVGNIDPAGKIVGLKTPDRDEPAEVTEGRTSSSPIIISQATYPLLSPEGLNVPDVKMAVTWRGYTYFAFEPERNWEIYLVEWDGKKWGRRRKLNYKKSLVSISKANSSWGEGGINVQSAFTYRYANTPVFILNQELWMMSVEDGRQSPSPIILCRAEYPASLPEESLQIPETKMAVTWHGKTFFPFVNNKIWSLVPWDGSSWGTKLSNFIYASSPFLRFEKDASNIYMRFERWSERVSNESFR